jgi:hypothetical protein
MFNSREVRSMAMLDGFVSGGSALLLALHRDRDLETHHEHEQRDDEHSKPDFAPSAPEIKSSQYDEDQAQ